MQQPNHWLLDAVRELENYAEENNLDGFLEGLSSVLEIYAAEAMPVGAERTEIISRVQK